MFEWPHWAPPSWHGHPARRGKSLCCGPWRRSGAPSSRCLPARPPPPRKRGNDAPNASFHWVPSSEIMSAFSEFSKHLKGLRNVTSIDAASPSQVLGETLGQKMASDSPQAMNFACTKHIRVFRHSGNISGSQESNKAEQWRQVEHGCCEESCRTNILIYVRFCCPRIRALSAAGFGFWALVLL